MPAAAQPVADAPRRRGHETAERILDVAEELFAERGYAGTTLRDVAGRVGLRIPSLYNHFPGKEALYAAVLERGLAPVLGVLSEYLDREGEAYQDAGRVVSRVIDALARHPNLARLIQHETLSGGERITPALRDWLARAFARADEMLAATPAAAGAAAAHAPHLVLALYHVVLGHFALAPLYRELRGTDLLSPEALDGQKRFLTELVETLLSRD